MRFDLARWLKLGLIGAGLLALLAVVNLGLLFFADYSMAGNGSPDPQARASWAWERGDHLHYGGHLIAGRILDLCPCSRNAAAAQYYYARFHAVTPRQRAVITNTRPASAAEWAAYATGPFVVWLDWAADGVAWLGGQRPTTQVLIELDHYEFKPGDIHVARGTTVSWRNVDEQGEVHTVTAASRQAVAFDSDWLLLGEQFQFTFTERGTYVYYCREHGEPAPDGMAGAIIVD